MTREAAIVLAGGRSSRMGRPKAALEWHGSTLLRRATGVLARVVDGPVVVVRAPGQELPPLAAAVEVTQDPCPGGGPLVGILAGLEAVRDRAEVAYVASTDAPGLSPAFARYVLDAVTADVDVALPDALGYRQPLAAAYRTALADVIVELQAADRLRPAFLFERCRVRVLGEDELRAADPELASLRNLNEPADYAAARAEPAPTVRLEIAGRAAVDVRAATLGAALAAAGVAAGDVGVTLDGRDGLRDPETPLVAGDVVRVGG